MHLPTYSNTLSTRSNTFLLGALTLLLAACGGSSGNEKSQLDNTSEKSQIAQSSVMQSSVMQTSSAPASNTSSSSQSSASSTSAATSSYLEKPTVNDLEVTSTGLTVHANGKLFDSNYAQSSAYQIDFGDGFIIDYPDAWHTYKMPGDYTITLRVTQNNEIITRTKNVNLTANQTNNAPIARLSTIYTGQSLKTSGSSSFDKEGSALTYEWDLGLGAFTGEPTLYTTVCDKLATSSLIAARTVTLTVSDGSLKDSKQLMLKSLMLEGKCNFIGDPAPRGKFSYVLDGLTLSVDASESTGDVAISWDFGDGTSAKGLLASHTYAAEGEYTVSLHISGIGYFSGGDSKLIKVSTAK